MAMNQLTQREHEVLQLAIDGLTNDEIASRLNISRRTVETHLRTIFSKTGVTRRTQLLALFRPDGSQSDGGPGNVPVEPPGQHDAATTGQRQQRRLQLYTAALRRLVDRQFPLFEERVEIIVTVGDREGRDSVLERRRTTPKPYVVYRVLRPIVAWTGGPPSDPDELALCCDVHGEDVRVDVCPMLDTDGQPLVMVVFQPGLQVATEWALHYCSPGLWSPLRVSGQDTLTWATATLDQRHRPTITELTLKVVFPAGWTGEAVTEQANLGTTDTVRLPAGHTEVTWRHGAPVAAAYTWVLRGRPA